MAQTKSKLRRTRGAPAKSPGGLKKVLFVRTNQGLIDKLDAQLERQQEKNPGMVLSRADVARTLLWDALRRADEENDE